MSQIYRAGIVRRIDGKTTIQWGGEHPTLKDCLLANIDYLEANLGKYIVFQKFTQPMAAAPKWAVVILNVTTMITISVPDCCHAMDDVKKIKIRKARNSETGELDLIMCVTTSGGTYVYPFDEYDRPITLLEVEFNPDGLPKSFGDGDD